MVYGQNFAKKNNQPSLSSASLPQSLVDQRIFFFYSFITFITLPGIINIQQKERYNVYYNM